MRKPKIDLRLSQLNCSRGAPHGRVEHHNLNIKRQAIDLYLMYVPFVDGGYDEGGAYWGSPANLYRAVNVELGIEMFVRASWRSEAEVEVRKHYPYAKFKRIDAEEMTQFAEGYIEAALCTSNDDDHESFEGKYPAKLEYVKILSDCNKFQKESEDLLRASGLTEILQGHNFWLNRNGHGTGFWDRDLGVIGDKLSESCKKFKPVDLYLDDEGDVCGW